MVYPILVCVVRNRRFVIRLGLGKLSVINVATVRHWFGSVKQFPSISLLLRVLAPGAPVGVSGGGDLTAEIAYGNHPGIAQHDVAIHKKDLRGRRVRPRIGI